MEACEVIDKYDDENSRIATFAGLNFQMFQFLIWSKFKLSQDLDNEALLK